MKFENADTFKENLEKIKKVNSEYSVKKLEIEERLPKLKLETGGLVAEINSEGDVKIYDDDCEDGYATVKKHHIRFLRDFFILIEPYKDLVEKYKYKDGSYGVSIYKRFPILVNGIEPWKDECIIKLDIENPYKPVDTWDSIACSGVIQ